MQMFQIFAVLDVSVSFFNCKPPPCFNFISFAPSFTRLAISKFWTADIFSHMGSSSVIPNSLEHKKLIIWCLFAQQATASPLCKPSLLAQTTAGPSGTQLRAHSSLDFFVVCQTRLAWRLVPALPRVKSLLIRIKLEF